MSVIIHESECAAAGLDPKEVRRIAAGFNRYARQAKRLGITIFGGTGSGSLRARDDDLLPQLIIADLDGPYDGGDGGAQEDENGLLRGE